jgi:hypothetical protein
VVAAASAAHAQAPFYTDDADVTPKGVVHLECFDEHDWLQLDLAPHLQQNTWNMKLNFGLGKGLELDIDSPLITIVNEGTIVPRLPFGIGDTNFGIKYNFHEEHKDGAAPALAAVLYVEVPTGNETTGLGSGLTDTWMYFVVQKSLPADWTLHANAGYLFTGNPSTGVVGITEARGHVLTVSGSIVKKISETLTLGGELAGAAANSAAQNHSQLQAMVGGSVGLSHNFALNLGVIAGRYAASPRFGVQVGFSWDINAKQ